MRKVATLSRMLLKIKDLVIDPENRVVMRADGTIDLPDLSFDVLVLLARCAPNPVKPSKLATGAWNAEHVSDETIAQRIKLLRKALGDTSKASNYIRTVRGVGYAMAAPVSHVARPVPRALSHFNPFTGAVIVAVAAAILMSGWMIWDTSSQKLTAAPKPTIATETELAETPGAREAAAIVDRANEQLRLHQARGTEHAITMLRSVLDKYPNHFEARLTLSFALTTKATKFEGDITHKEEAETLARALIGEQPENSNAWSALAYTVGSQGRSDEAIASYEYAIQLNPDNIPAISSVAYEYLMRGQLHHALVMEHRAYKTAGHSLYSEIQIAQVLELIGHPAYKNWQARAAALNPGQVVMLSELARSHIRKGELKAALAVLDQTNDTDCMAPQILQLRGRIALMQGDVETARSFFNRAGRYTNKDLAALNAKYGDPNEATSAAPDTPSGISKMVSVSSPDTHIPYAELSAAMGERDTALTFIAQAVNLGWRDTAWLRQSPYLKELMASPEGDDIERHIARELAAQKQLINTDASLAPITSIRANDSVGEN